MKAAKHTQGEPMRRLEERYIAKIPVPAGVVRCGGPGDARGPPWLVQVLQTEGAMSVSMHRAGLCGSCESGCILQSVGSNAFAVSTPGVVAGLLGMR
eukprot:5807333-Pleurochrysis_carterae.AAC.1